jgi:major membrane immunogen (membrane-anchored lipoprotein)
MNINVKIFIIISVLLQTHVILQGCGFDMMSSTTIAEHTTKMSKRNKNDIDIDEKSVAP